MVDLSIVSLTFTRGFCTFPSTTRPDYTKVLVISSPCVPLADLVAPGVWPALRGVFADSLETKYQGAAAADGGFWVFGEASRPWIFFDSSEPQRPQRSYFLWDLL